MELFESTTFIWGLFYLSTTPLLLKAPELVFKVIFFGASTDCNTDDNRKAMLAVFLGLTVVATPSYIISAIKGYSDFIHITLAQRLTVVFAAIIVTGIVKQDPFEFGNFSYTMFLIADVVPAVIKGFLTPGEKSRGFTKIKSKYNLDSYEHIHMWYNYE